MDNKVMKIEYFDKTLGKLNVVDEITNQKRADMQVCFSFINAQHSAETCIDHIKLSSDKAGLLELAVYDYDSSFGKTYKEKHKVFKEYVEFLKSNNVEIYPIIEKLKSLDHPKKPKRKLF